LLPSIFRVIEASARECNSIGATKDLTPGAGMPDPTSSVNDELSQLALSPVFLLYEFIESGIEPIVARAREMIEEDRHDFYLGLFPYLIAHCRELGIPAPHETAMFLINVVKCRL
jgi:hypothetical protein